jgi:hypothetical protein
VPAPALTLRAYQVDPSFLWAPSAARAVIFSWARDTWIAQRATLTEPFAQLPDDCAGDVLEYLDLLMTRKELLRIATYCSSAEANDSVRAVVAAVAVSADNFRGMHVRSGASQTSCLSASTYSYTSYRNVILMY